MGDGLDVAIVGALNVSPESFYSGSVVTDADRLLQAAEAMVQAGAAWLDVGAMSTAPYLEAQIPETQEADRLHWAVGLLTAKLDLPVCADTSRALPARAALESGARMLNDVTGLAADPALARLAAEAGAGLVLMAAPAAAPAVHPALRALLSRPYPAVMGVLNVTPDSFSDGGQFDTPERALAQARRMIAEGADIIDIGAESTRPYGAEPVSAEEELERLRPVLADVVSLGAPVSIDSMESSVVGWALDAGAAMANDVWGLQRDPGMAGLLAARNSPVIVMHNRDRVDAGIDIMKDIAAFFARSLEIAAKAGISRGNIVLDPGIGFGKTPEQSMTALARLNELGAFGLPLLVSASRKRFISSVVSSEPDRRLGGSIAAHVVAAKGGARIIRTHDVSETAQALRVAAAIWDRR